MQTNFSFHEGERSVQLRAGEAGIADRNSVMIANTILGGARPFIEQQLMVVLASIDAEGAVWSSVQFGNPGFAHAKSSTAVSIEAPLISRDNTDPFWANIDFNPSIGMLFIELESRRRYRINGQLVRNDGLGIEVSVLEAYANCPKYIQKRHLNYNEKNLSIKSASSGTAIDTQIKNLIRAADTMFVATNNSKTGADSSHRGGNSGFIKIINEHELQIPDYDGNSLFNTLGNIQLEPRTGLCIPNFDGQQLLQLTGKSELLWDQEDPNNLTGGTHRFWKFELERWILRSVPKGMNWNYLGTSPFNLPTEP